VKMSIQYISWMQARDLVLERLRQWVQSLPPAERGLKILWGQRLLSPLDILREVEILSDLGRQIINSELAKISQEVGITYVITG